MNAVLRSLLSKLDNYDEADRRNDEAEGARACVSPDPTAAAAILGRMQKALLTHCEALAVTCARLVRGEVRDLDAVAQRLKVRVHETLRLRGAANTNRHDRRLRGWSDAQGQGSARHGRLKQDHQDSQERLDAIQLRHKDPERGLRIYVVGWLYVLLMVALVALDAPLNKLSFELFFADTQLWIPWAWAISAGALLMLFAHFGGTWSRQITTAGRSGWLIALNIVGILMIFAMAGLLIYALAALRQGYIDFVSGLPTGGLSAGVFADAPSAPEQMAAMIGSTELKGPGILLFVLNAAVFAAALVLSLAAHDPDADFEPAVRREARARRALEAFENAYAAHAAKIDARKADEAAYTGRMTQAVAPRLADAERRRDRLGQELGECLNAIAANFGQRLAAQCRGFEAQAARLGLGDIAFAQMEFREVREHLAQIVAATAPDEFEHARAQAPRAPLNGAEREPEAGGDGFDPDAPPPQARPH